MSGASNLSSEDTNDLRDIYVYDAETSSTVLISRTPSGRAGNGASTHPAISTDGRFVAFQSESSDLVCTKRCSPGDTDINLVSDVFLFDRERRVTSAISVEPGSQWMEPSRSPAVDAAGRVVAFPSRVPVAEHDRGNHFDLFIRRLCPSQ